MKYTIIDDRLRNPSLDPQPMVPSSKGANSVDLRACILGELTIFPNESVLLGTGIKIALPKDTIGMIIPRSGLGNKGLILGNGVGNIDPDYRGELKVSLWNRTDTQLKINALDRIAQLIVIPTYVPSWIKVSTLDTTERGEKGFGSTGEN